MTETQAYASTAALQTGATAQGAVALLTEPGREGAFIWRSGNFVAEIAADPRKGLYVPSSTTLPTIGCWVRDWDGVNGRPEWFGARPDDPAADNRAALSACFALCPVTQLGARDYYVQGTLTFDHSNKAFAGVPGAPVNRDVGVGAPARMGNVGGSRVILTGPRVVEDTVLQFGKPVPPSSDGEALMRNSVLRDINFCRDNEHDHRARNSRTNNPIDCVKGIVCSGLSSCRIENVASFDSPVGWHCFGCVYTKWDDCAAWRSTPAAVATNDFSVGFLIGDFTRHYGYAGANASVYFNRCICYDLSGGSVSIALRLFGAIADTFLTQIEVGRCDVGIEIDGQGRDGTTIALNQVDTQQDIHIINPVIDGTRGQGLQLRNLNASFQVSVISPYIVSARALADINIMGGAARVEGHVSIVGGTLMTTGGNGLVAVDGEGISVIGTLLRNYKVPVSLTNCRSCRIEPDVFNYAEVAANGLYLKDLQRSSVKPVVRGTRGRPGFGTGIMLDGGANNEIDPTMVDPDSFTTPGPERKVLFRGEDARSSEAFRATGNVLIGVTG
jgi:hypothetical protein